MKSNKKSNKEYYYLAVLNTKDNTVIIYSSSQSNKKLIKKLIKNNEDNNYEIYSVSAKQIADVVPKLENELGIELERISRQRNSCREITHKF